MNITPAQFQNQGRVTIILKMEDPIDFDYMLSRQNALKLTPGFMAGQPDINAKMYTILVNWLYEVNTRFNLHRTTLHLAIGMLVRYLSSPARVARGKLQLAGIACLWTASKWEEIYPTEMSDIIYIIDNGYRRDEIIDMERDVLAQLDYELHVPTVVYFKHVYVAGTVDARENALIWYVLDLSLLFCSLFAFAPSELVQAAVHIARAVCGGETAEPSDPAVGAAVAELQTALRWAQSATYRYQAIQKAYAKPRHWKVSESDELKKYLDTATGV